MPLIPEADEQYLKDKQFDYQLTQAGPEIHLILRGWPFPEAYTLRTADVLIRIPAGYPAGRLDMFYTHPTVMRTTGTFPDRCDQMEAHGGRTWQRWSRHHDWRDGIDDLRTFITAMTIEIKKGI
jgi:hypothetical protein